VGRVDIGTFDGLVLPGGHAPGMRQYLEAEALFAKVAEAFEKGMPVGAICHGTVVLARTKGARGASVLHGRRARRSRSTWSGPPTSRRSGSSVGTTAPTPSTWRTRSPETSRAPADYQRGPFELSARGTDTDDRHAFVVEDGSYVSARWPGDAYLFAKRFMAPPLTRFQVLGANVGRFSDQVSRGYARGTPGHPRARLTCLSARAPSSEPNGPACAILSRFTRSISEIIQHFSGTRSA
jgi:putative intracellular protease/amidase